VYEKTINENVDNLDRHTPSICNENNCCIPVTLKAVLTSETRSSVHHKGQLTSTTLKYQYRRNVEDIM